MSPLETALAIPQGVQRGSITGLQGIKGTSLGGELVLVSACLTVSPLITGGQAHTHGVVHAYVDQKVMPLTSS
jgi:hypothetical protein